MMIGRGLTIVNVFVKVGDLLKGDLLVEVYFRKKSIQLRCLGTSGIGVCQCLQIIVIVLCVRQTERENPFLLFVCGMSLGVFRHISLTCLVLSVHAS